MTNLEQFFSEYLSFFNIFIEFCSDGKLDIVVPSFVHYLEVLDGSDGDKMPGMFLWLVFIFFNLFAWHVPP